MKRVLALSLLVGICAALPCQAQFLKQLEQGLLNSGQGQQGLMPGQAQLVGTVNLPPGQYLMQNCQTGQAFYVNVQNGQMFLNPSLPPPGATNMMAPGGMIQQQQQGGGLGGGLGNFLKNQIMPGQQQQGVPQQATPSFP